MDIEERLAQELFPNNPEKREELKRNFKYWDKLMQPLIDELKRSSILSAKDYSPLVYAS